MTATDTYDRALQVFGRDSQLRMVVEECAELQVAVCHMMRGRTNTDELCSEIADVLIVLEQLPAMLEQLTATVPGGAVLVAEAKAMKLKRLLGRVQTAEQARASDGVK